jgi:gliding motility-associated-like protein
MRQTERILGCLILVAFLFSGYSAKSELFYNNGANVYLTEGSFVFVDGIVHNQSGQIEVYENVSNIAEYIIHDDFINNATTGGNGYNRVLGAWINKSILNTGTWTGFLEEENQILDGRVSTTFNNLTLDVTGLKTQTVDQFCVGILDMKDLELQNETHGFFVQNTDVNAIIRTTGFVSALDGGFLSRQTNSTADYLIPVGSRDGTLRYRPDELTSENANANTYTVRMANVLAITEVSCVTAFCLGVCEVNSEFWHQIDRTVGTAAFNINLFNNENDDGFWDGLADWEKSPNQLSLILGSVNTTGTPYNEAYVCTWGDFIKLPFILCRFYPEANIIDPGDFCVNDAAVDLTAVDPGGTWSGTGIIDSINGTFDPSVAGTGTHSVIYNSPGNSGASDTISIVVHPSSFVVDYSVTKPNCFGAADAQIDFSVLGGTPPYTYNWGNSSADTSPIVGLNSGIYHFTISDINGCKVNLETIYVSDGNRDCLRIPDAFTPNGDGVNDEFIIENLIFYTESVLQIFNRLGQLLYEGGPNSDPWDGTYNGNPVPAGSYIYVLALKTELEDVVGVVTLVR